MALPVPQDGAPSRRSRRNLTYREKLAIVHKKEEEPSWTQRNLAMWAKETFRLENKPTQATISNLLRSKDKLLSAVVPPEFRSARRVRHPELDQKMLRWVHQELQSGGCVTRASIQSAAVELAQEMQLPSDVTFSKGWVSSFMNRHRINFPTKNGDRREQETIRQDMLAITAEAVRRAEQAQVLVQVQVQEESEEEEMETVVVEDNSVEVEEEQVEEVPEVEPTPTSVVTEDSSPMQSAKRRKVDDESNSVWQSREEEGRATGELLLDWIAVPGSYSRWWLLKNDEEKEPLCNEINLFLRSHGLRGMNSLDIRQQLTTFVMTFQAAYTWLRQTKVEYPSVVADTTLEQEGIKSHVLQMCPHYERLVSVLAPYVNYDDSTANAAQSNEAPATATMETTALVSGDATPSTQARDSSVMVESPPKPGKERDASVAIESPPKPAKESRRQSTESTTDHSIDDETKAQKRRLFELECARLQSEIETRNVQLMLEKTLARKKLLDAGISAAEVDRIFPL